VLLQSMAGHAPKGEALLPGFDLLAVFSIMAAVFGIHWTMRGTTVEAVLERTPVVVLGPVWALMLFAVIIEQGRGNAFIYFAF